MATAVAVKNNARFAREVVAAHHSHGTHAITMPQGTMVLLAHMDSHAEDVEDSADEAVDVAEGDEAVDVAATTTQTRRVRKTRLKPPETRGSQEKTTTRARQVFNCEQTIRLENIRMKIRWTCLG